MALSWLEWLEQFVVSKLFHAGSHPDSALEQLDDLATKPQRIQKCLEQSPVNLWELRELALSTGGLMEPKYRKQAWPLLIGLEDDEDPLEAFAKMDVPASSSAGGVLSTNAEASYGSEEKKNDISHREASFDMIRRDVGRSVVFHYQPIVQTNNENDDIPNNPTLATTTTTTTTTDDDLPAIPSARSLSYASERLTQALEQTIHQSSSYHYYQGLHDVAGVVLHQLDYQVDLGTAILSRLAISHWRDALRENFSNLTWMLHTFLNPLIQTLQPSLHEFLTEAAPEWTNLPLPWLITWFTHDILQEDTAASMVDAFMASHPALPLYVTVALLTHPLLQNHIYSIDPNDTAALLLFLRNLPQYISLLRPNQQQTESVTVTVQEMLDDALVIMQRFPPRALLDFVDDASIPRSELLEQANSISLFKAACSWNLAASHGTLAVPPGSEDVVFSDKDHDDTSTPTWLSLDSFSSSQPTGNSSRSTSSSHGCVRARLASGVPMLMDAAATAPCLKSAHWGSRAHLSRRKSTLTKKLQTTIRRFLSGQ